MKCSNCGTENDENQKICRVCGNTLQIKQPTSNTYNPNTYTQNQHEFQDNYNSRTYTNHYRKEEFVKKDPLEEINKNIGLIIAILLLVILIILINFLIFGVPVKYY